MTTPAVSVLPTEQDELNELASIGIVLDGPTTDSQLDAWASEVCRRLAIEVTEIERYTEAEKAEIARIQMRYASMREPHERRAQDLEAIGKDLAERADFGNKKSRSVGFGSYGRKKSKERVKIIDETAALAFARGLNLDGAIKTETVEKPVHKVLEPVVIEYVHKNEGVVPAGFEHIEARDEPFVKAE